MSSQSPDGPKKEIVDAEFRDGILKTNMHLLVSGKKVKRMRYTEKLLW